MTVFAVKIGKTIETYPTFKQAWNETLFYLVVNNLIKEEDKAKIEALRDEVKDKLEKEKIGSCGAIPYFEIIKTEIRSFDLKELAPKLKINEQDLERFFL